MSKVSIPEEVILSKIYEIRGQKVMLDRDLAELYEVETRVLKQLEANKQQELEQKKEPIGYKRGDDK